MGAEGLIWTVMLVSYTRKLLKNVAALGIGILFSLAIVGLLELGLRLNRSFGWVDLHTLASSTNESSFRVQESWEGVDKKFLAAIPDRFAEIRKKYGNRVLQQVPMHFLPGPNQDGSYSFLKFAPDGEMIYDAFYRFNDRQRRPTPGQPKKSDASIYLVGCSYTIGEGVSENETMAAYMQAGLKRTAVETLAFHGWGIGNHLSFLRGEGVEADRPNPYRKMATHPVIVVYPFIPDHIYRTTCPLLCYQKEYRWMLGFPNYEVNEAGEVKYLGSFAESRVFSPLLRLAASSAIATEFGLGWVYPGGTTALKRYFEILNAYRSELGKHILIKDFYFVPIEPYFPFDEKVTAMAQENGYKVLDLGKLALPEMLGKGPRIPFDGHFIPQVNYLLSELILSRVQKDHPDLR